MIDAFRSSDTSIDIVLAVMILLYCIVFAFCRQYVFTFIIECFRPAGPSDADDLRAESRARTALFLTAWSTLALVVASAVAPPWPTIQSKWFVCLLSCLLIFVIFKYLLITFWGWVFDSSELSLLLWKGMQNHAILGSIVSLPFLLIGFCISSNISTVFFVVYCIVQCISVLLYIFYCLKIFISIRYSIVFGILYLCTLEILPIMAIFQVYRSNIL